MNPSTVPLNTPLKPIRDTNAQDTVLDCTLKYKPRNPHWENTWTKKIIIIVHSFNVNPVKPSLGKLGKNPQKKTISLPPFLCKQVEV